ncbi:hypothetical protein AGMMS50256_34390 [Betaproteobacteria bacterium]|nr:hypothetical protein AGMMS50256_34390 [Betaproteobacteria bacterium]
MNTMQITATPSRILGLYDQPFWDYLKQTGQMYLQCCSDCGARRYPPGPACPTCLSSRYEWKPVSGEGKILSWVTFHKQYLPQYPAPYNVIAVCLDEGQTIISNLTTNPEPGDKLIGRRVRLVVTAMDDGVALPRFEFADA